jgi:hypothetical protein
MSLYVYLFREESVCIKKEREERRREREKERERERERREKEKRERINYVEKRDSVAPSWSQCVVCWDTLLEYTRLSLFSLLSLFLVRSLLR